MMDKTDSPHTGPLPDGLAVFESFGPASDWSFVAASPVSRLVARQADEVADLLALVQRELARGAYCALALSYEAAAAFDPGLATPKPAPGTPAAVALFYDRLLPGPPASGDPLGPASDIRPEMDPQAYRQACRRIEELLRAGECYQVNLTFPLSLSVPAGLGELYALWRKLGRVFRPGYAAFADLGELVAASWSPELFFARTGDDILARPMKGTMRRGRHAAEDLRLGAELAACPKNRAENVMIVDLMRNDLGRLAVPGGVRAEELFAVERYPTVWQMVSTVRARLRPGVGLWETLAALFPCGSVTGAPKRAAMRAIAQLETGPRGLYCGALGYLLPDGRQRFNVPIRTLVAARDQGRAVFHVGSGVTVASSGAEEWSECLLKADFLTREPAVFEVFETMLAAKGDILFLNRHLERLAASAGHFDRAFDERRARDMCLALARSLGPGRFRLRLALAMDGALRLEHGPAPARPAHPARLGLARAPREPGDQLCYHKTSLRQGFDDILASRPGAWDVLLHNANGQLTETCRANIVLEIKGERLTPALECGLLPGILRQVLLERGWMREAGIDLADLKRADVVYCANALRGLTRCVLP